MLATALVLTKVSFHRRFEIIAEGTQIESFILGNRERGFTRIQIKALPNGRIHLQAQERIDDRKPQFAMPFASRTGVPIRVLE
jgi:hypothetical protein